jgi:hypothetical protein
MSSQKAKGKRQKAKGKGQKAKAKGKGQKSARTQEAIVREEKREMLSSRT